jgi:hypothetical protein
MRVIDSYKLDSFDFTTGLFAAYRFEDNLTDFKGGYNGTNDSTGGLGTLFSYVTGKVNKARQHTNTATPSATGGGWRYSGDNSTFTFTGAFTWAMWVYFDNISTNNWLLSKRDETTNGEYAFLYSLATSSISLILYDDALTNLIRKNWLIGSVSTGTWYHLVVTHDGGTALSGMKLFVNGAEVAAGSTSTGGTYLGQANEGGLFAVGRPSWNSVKQTPDQFFYGKMDNLYIYKDRQLSAEEILEMYTRENAGTNAI